MLKYLVSNKRKSDAQVKNKEEEERKEEKKQRTASPVKEKEKEKEKEKKPKKQKINKKTGRVIYSKKDIYNMDAAKLVALECEFLELSASLDAKYAKLDRQFLSGKITEKKRDSGYTAVDLEIKDLESDFNVKWLESAMKKKDPPALNRDRLDALLSTNHASSIEGGESDVSISIDSLAEPEIDEADALEEDEDSDEPASTEAEIMKQMDQPTRSNNTTPQAKYGRVQNPFAITEPFVNDFTPTLTRLMKGVSNEQVDTEFIKLNNDIHKQMKMKQERGVAANQARVCSLCFYHPNYKKLSDEPLEEYNRNHPNRDDEILRCKKRTCKRIWHRKCIVEKAPFVKLSEIANVDKKWRYPKCVYGLDEVVYHLEHPGEARELDIPTNEETEKPVQVDSDSKEEKKEIPMQIPDEPQRQEEEDSEEEEEEEKEPEKEIKHKQQETEPEPEPEPSLPMAVYNDCEIIETIEISSDSESEDDISGFIAVSGDPF